MTLRILIENQGPQRPDAVQGPVGKKRDIITCRCQQSMQLGYPWRGEQRHLPIIFDPSTLGHTLPALVELPLGFLRVLSHPVHFTTILHAKPLVVVAAIHAPARKRATQQTALETKIFACRYGPVLPRFPG